MTESADIQQSPSRVGGQRRRTNLRAGLLPFIGVILFVVVTIPQLIGAGGEGWGPALVTNGVTYLIGWAGVGAWISHIFFSSKISKTIGFEKSPYELEVGFADLAMGVVALLASRYSPEFSLAVILINAIFRVGCGFGHIGSLIRDRNVAINNTAILFIDFVVPAFLITAYFTVWG